MTDLQLTIDAQTLKALLSGEPDGMRKLAQDALNQLLESEMDDHLGARKGERTQERTGYRNGHYERDLTTRVGTLTLRVPRDRDGRFSTALFERYTRCEQALVSTLVEMVVNGVSTRKVKRITEELCGKAFSKSTISSYCECLSEQVQKWRERDLGQNPFVLVDALHVKVRQDNKVVSMALLIAVGINKDGKRRILGCELGQSECYTSWLGFMRALKERGLTGVEVLTSDAHSGLVSAVNKVFGEVRWQRCQTHFRRNVSDATPKKHQDALHEGLDELLKADTKEDAREAKERLVEELSGKCEKALDVLESGWEDACAVLALPAKYRRRLRTTNMVERLNRDVRRRDKVIGIYPNEESAMRLLGIQLVEKDEDWSTSGTYLDMDDFFAWKRRQDQKKQDHEQLLAAAE